MGAISVLGKFAHERPEEEMSFEPGADIYREFTSTHSSRGIEYRAGMWNIP